MKVCIDRHNKKNVTGNFDYFCANEYSTLTEHTSNISLA